MRSHAGATASGRTADHALEGRAVAGCGLTVGKSEVPSPLRGTNLRIEDSRVANQADLISMSQIPCTPLARWSRQAKSHTDDPVSTSRPPQQIVNLVTSESDLRHCQPQESRLVWVAIGVNGNARWYGPSSCWPRPTRYCTGGDERNPSCKHKVLGAEAAQRRRRQGIRAEARTAGTDSERMWMDRASARRLKCPQAIQPEPTSEKTPG